MIKLKHGNFKDCSLRVPYNPTTSVIKLTDLSKSYYFSVIPSSSYEISAIFAKSLGLSETREVSLESTALRPCSKVEIEPADEDSWEILSQNAGFVEGNFLSQIRVVQKSMVLPLWVHSCCIWIRVVALDGDWGVLQPNSEILVKPRDRPQRFKGKVLRAGLGDLEIGTNEFPDGSLVACGLNSSVVVGVCKNGKYQDGHAYSYLLEPFEKYKVIQVLTFQNGIVCFLNKFNGDVKTANGEVFVSCTLNDFNLVLGDHGKIALFDGMKVKLRSGKFARVRVESLINTQEWTGFVVLCDARGVRFEGTPENEERKKEIVEIPSFVESAGKVEKIMKRVFSLCVEGSPGVGKSTFIDILAKKYENELIAPVILSCRAFSKKEFDKKLLETIEKAKRCSPSILFLDDLETVCGKIEDNQGEEAKIISNLNSLLLLSFLDTSKYSHQIKTIITCKSKSCLSPLLTTSSFFSTSKKIPSLSHADITKLLSHHFPSLSTSPLAVQMKSFTILDIIHFSHSSRLLFGDSVSLADLLSHISKFIPSALDSKSTPSEKITPWSEIGGMFEAKSLIWNSFTFPVKYRALYSNYPARLRSGMLLFGPPGCGKTLIASAISGICGMSSISVKGPELLNKYIGASEQSVRELFERAKRVKPSLIIFDEFEAIVPKRGSGISASTDRIVNQFLCELDGVEARENVFIVAVSSRPELIDQALLRPGRLDFHVFCDFPNREERKDILKVIAGKIGVFGEFTKCAEKMEGFTPADIQGVFNDLQIKIAHQEIDFIDEGVVEEQVEVTRPSFNQNQIFEMNQRFRNFIHRKNPEVGKKMSYY
jgi:SpoVK/Ycf46/Vps4 family AAA+-type ATPase